MQHIFIPYGFVSPALRVCCRLQSRCKVTQEVSDSTGKPLIIRVNIRMKKYD